MASMDKDIQDAEVFRERRKTKKTKAEAALHKSNKRKRREDIKAGKTAGQEVERGYLSLDKTDRVAFANEFAQLMAGYGITADSLPDQTQPPLAENMDGEDLTSKGANFFHQLKNSLAFVEATGNYSQPIVTNPNPPSAAALAKGRAKRAAHQTEKGKGKEKEKAKPKPKPKGKGKEKAVDSAPARKKHKVHLSKSVVDSEDDAMDIEQIVYSFTLYYFEYPNFPSLFYHLHIWSLLLIPSFLGSVYNKCCIMLV